MVGGSDLDGAAGAADRHELRTHLTTILGHGQLLALEELTARQQVAVAEILAAGARLLDLLESSEPPDEP